MSIGKLKLIRETVKKTLSLVSPIKHLKSILEISNVKLKAFFTLPFTYQDILGI